MIPNLYAAQIKNSSSFGCKLHIKRRRNRNQDHISQESDEKRTKSIYRKKIMRKEYDFLKMKGRKNPYAKRLKKQVTIRMGIDIIEYFKLMSENTGIPYQNLINLYLRDCVQSGRKISIKWASKKGKHNRAVEPDGKNYAVYRKCRAGSKGFAPAGYPQRWGYR